MEDSKSVSPLSESEERNWAVLSHLGVFAKMIVPFGCIVLPLLVWQLNKEKSEYVTIHGREALNFQITMLLAYVVSALFCIVLIGFPMLLATFIVDVVYSIKGAMAASRNEYFEYPHNLRLVS